MTNHIQSMLFRNVWRPLRLILWPVLFSPLVESKVEMGKLISYPKVFEIMLENRLNKSEDNQYSTFFTGMIIQGNFLIKKTFKYFLEIHYLLHHIVRSLKSSPFDFQFAKCIQ